MEANGNIRSMTGVPSKKRLDQNPKHHNNGIALRAPHTKPPFTLNDLRRAIPPHCFHRSLLRSFSYVALDLTTIFLFCYAAIHFLPLLPQPLAYAAWPVYWFLQGCVTTGIWVVAHECGHGAFSDYAWVNNAVGFVIYSSLLIPFFSFKYSHRRHHSNTCSVEHDEVFVPRKKDEIQWYYRCFNNPPGRVLTLAVTLLAGWPTYLAFNVSGRVYHDGFASHFNPNAPIYSSSERLQVYLSNIGVMATLYGLYRLALANGLPWLLGIYGVPLLVQNAFLVAITFLQHTHPALPHYDSSEWDWLRGAVATVDRDYGVLNKIFHNITDTHVVHHLFPSMPHYHAMEATRVVRPIMGKYYRFDGTPIWKALWREAKECLYVEADGGDQSNISQKGVLWFKNKF